MRAKSSSETVSPAARRRATTSPIHTVFPVTAPGKTHRVGTDTAADVQCERILRLTQDPF